ncbi:MAG: cardiolipin synthase [Bdellovibrionaceae bacterium]|nr:cardiolipin synthase [Pseudobdellovibrionaceae bacterium]MBX3034002.1 cardiolipin synthase [Pseudobdellovibrionaceae bacterium]
MWTWFFFFFDLLLRLIFSYRILRRRLPVSVAWAWLGLILFFPFAGTFLYLFVGEYRLGRRRRRRLRVAHRSIAHLIRKRFAHRHDEKVLPEPLRSAALTARGLFGAPLLLNNSLELLPGADRCFARMIADIDAARKSCDMEFYIWSDKGRADDFGEALIRAAGRGVRVRVLVDQIGSAKFLKGPMVERLRQAGVQVHVALPAGLWQALFSRPDLRLHRKILVIDGDIGYTGSLNLADPKYFNLSVGVGPWVDALCRVQGPAVEALHLVFLSDWSLESRHHFSTEDKGAGFAPALSAIETSSRRAQVQCLPSEPAASGSDIEQVLISLLYLARQEILLTTPYFVPSEALLSALTSAARRGVQVTLIVPARVDSRLTQAASQLPLKILAESGARVALYQPGLLHTKSVTVDGAMSLFGSLNLDPRSLRINFEITLAVYDEVFTRELRLLQEEYLSASVALESDQVSGRLKNFKEDLARLLGPLL